MSVLRRARLATASLLEGAVASLLPRGVRGRVRAQEDPNTMSRRLSGLRQRGFRARAILDIGAHRGEWSRLAARVFPEASFLLVEAQPSKRETLERLCSQDPRFHFASALLGRENRSETTFYLWDMGSSIFPERTRYRDKFRKISLPMARLDDLVRGFPFERFDLLKLDVQGAELEILGGGPRTFAAAEVVIAEVSAVEYNEDAPLLGDVIGELGERGFVLDDLCDVVRREPGGRLLQMDAFFVRADSPLRDRGRIW